jgi:hypothetical protein
MDLYSFKFLNMNPYSYTGDPGPGVKIFYFKSENSTFLEKLPFPLFSLMRTAGTGLQLKILEN